MKAEEVGQVALDKRKELVDYQMRNLLIRVKEAAGKGEFEIRAYSIEFSTSKNTGWLLEVIQKLREEGYSVLTYGDHNQYDTVYINWKPEVEPAEVTNEEPRPTKEPNFTGRSWWKPW